MLDRLPRILRSPHQQRIRPRRRPQRQLIERQTLPPRLLNPLPRRGREPQRRHRHFRHREQTRIIGDGANNNDGFVSRRFGIFGGGVVGVGFGRGGGDVAGEAGEGEGGAVDAGGEEAAEDDAVEGAVGAA